MDTHSIYTIAFSACAANGMHIWGYRMRDDYALAYQINNQDIPITTRQRISANIDLTTRPVTDNVFIEWSSSHPEIISESGRYNPTGLTEDTPVDLSVHISAGDYYWHKTYSVTAKAEEFPTHDWKSGAVAYYDFDSNICYNRLDSTERAYFLKTGNNNKPTLKSDEVRNGKFVHLTFGSNGNESYVSIPNPFLKEEIEEGITLSFWAKRNNENAWDALFAFYNNTNNTRLYMTGGCYVGYNNNAGNWIDINYPSSYNLTPIPVNKWNLITVTISRKATNGISMYINGTKVSDCTYNGILDGANISKGTTFDYNQIIDHITTCPKFTLGYGSFWGSPDVYIDDLIMHNRILSRLEISALKQMMNRVYDIGEAVNIKGAPTTPSSLIDGNIYDLHGRLITNPTQGIYLHNGKKVFIK